MKRYWTQFKNFCSDNWFGVACVTVGVVGFAVATAVVIFFPPALPAILAWAPFGGVPLFGFLATTAAVNIPAAAAAFGAICTAALLVAGGLFRGIVGVFNAITRSAKEDIKDRNLALAPSGEDINGNVVPKENVEYLNKLLKGKPTKGNPVAQPEQHRDPLKREKQERNQPEAAPQQEQNPSPMMIS